jgi:protein ImuB
VPDPATARAVRTVVVACPDWPVTAAGYPGDVPAAVFHANRAVAVSAAARAEGVRRGHRRREAQARCPELVVIGHDPDRDAREFEPVVTVVEALAPGVAVVEPGLLALRARGPARYFGGDEQVVELLTTEATVRLRGLSTARAGVADGLFPALLAARAGQVVPPGRSREFLAPQDISMLTMTGAAGTGPERDALVDLLRRLGLHTLGDFAAIPPADVASRFDSGGVLAHRMARGVDPLPVSGRAVPVDLEVETAIDPPADRVETASFTARALAHSLQERLAGHGLACTRLTVLMRTENGEEHSRCWRGDGALSTSAITDRTRWQLDGWLTGRGATRPTAGVTLLRLVAEEVVEHAGRQLTLWGGWDEGGERAQRGMTRVQAMLGPESVVVPVLGGGRGPQERVRLVAWQEERTPLLPPDPPWPGRLPAPHPTLVLDPPEPVTVRDPAGVSVSVSARQHLSGPPAVLRRGGADLTVLAWAGPWTVDERWWDTTAGRRLARLQVVVGGAERTDALLLVSDAGGWAVEGVYG